MMLENENIPKIRFKGFTKPWEHRRFGELLKTISFKPFLKVPEDDGKYEVIQQGSQPIIGFANGTPCNKYKDTVIFGDHTLSFYKPKRPFFVATDGVRIIKGKEYIEGYYLLSLLRRHKPQSEGYKRYYGILVNTECFVTYNTGEQRQIGVFFENLDNLINLYEQKCEKLTQIKKSMLEKMFPHEGKNVPEIRFKGFTKPWEHRRFGELLKTISFKPFLKVPEDDGKYEVIQQGSQPIIGFANGTPCNKYKDTVIFGDHTLSFYKPKRPFFVATDGVRIIKGKEYIEGYYLLSLLRRHKPQSEGYKRYYGILVNTECFVTYNTGEQRQIGVFFENLDNLINLYEQKCEKLTQIKKSLLEKMFAQ